MGNVKEAAKNVVNKVSNAAKSSDKGNEVIENDALDHTPPGSANLKERGVPSREANESRGGATAKPPARPAAEEPEVTQIVHTTPFKPVNPITEARAKAREARQLSKVESNVKARSAGKGSKLSARAIAHLIRAAGSADELTAKELNNLLSDLDVHPDTLREVQELAKNPKFFQGDQRPGNLDVLSLPPGAQKPPEFEAAPGTTGIPDTRYFPTRYAMIPDEENFEDGDLIYCVHEDNSYFALSVYQQSREWQTANHLPPCNLITRIGGEVENMPKELRKSGMIDRNEDIEENYDAKTAEAK